MKNNTGDKKNRKRLLSWRSWHKWVGLVFSIFILLFCFSGIVLNHRKFFSRLEVSRSFLPKGYHITSWNQSIIKGTLPFEDGLIAYGGAGLWLTDSTFASWKEFNDGIDKGIDNRKISNVVMTSDGSLWCAALFDAYRYDGDSGLWKKVSLPGNKERVSDIAARGGDTLVVVTRSKLYEGIVSKDDGIASKNEGIASKDEGLVSKNEGVAPDIDFREITLKTPEDYSSKVTLFKTFWMIHSGELFGIVGKLIVDAMAIVLIILCITGIIFFVLSYSVKARVRKKKDVSHQVSTLKGSLKWHNKVGASVIILTLILSITGMCLRPPLMIPLAITNVKPVPGSTLASKNAFNDKLRAIRWDDSLSVWLLSTGDAFYRIGENLSESVPEKIEGAPSVSPMGINVFCKDPDNVGCYLIGSFSGLVSWNPQTGEMTDWFTGQAPSAGYHGVVSSHSVTGYSEDLACTPQHKPVVFDYSSAPVVSGNSSEPSEILPEMPEQLKHQRMSLWNFALELHVGRCYEPFLGSVLSVLFVFLSGLILTLTLLSGYILYRRSKKKQPKKN